MKERCYNTKHPKYRLYGAKGVVVCERWKHSYPNFLADMGERPNGAFSLDRFPNNAGNYEPGNCRWATPDQQNTNKKTNRLLTHAGRTLTLSQWAKELGWSRTGLSARISRLGIEGAMSCKI